MKIGVMTPTFNRPDCIRSLVLQMQNQSRKPDLLVIHHNGNAQSYEWAIADITTDIEIVWLHTPEVISQHQWYSVPLQRLIEAGCSHFFWCDHDDFYYRDHIAKAIEVMQAEMQDFIVNQKYDLVLLKKAGVVWHRNYAFEAHAPGGMSSSMSFNRRFAEKLLRDLITDNDQHYWSDNVVKFVTMPGFTCGVAAHLTTAYIAHAGTVSSTQWVTGE